MNIIFNFCHKLIFSNTFLDQMNNTIKILIQKS
jgi:hypothetical protein